MALRHVLKITSIYEYFANETKVIKKGENALESNHVKKMDFDADLMIIRGEIFASMKDKWYSVEITLSKTGDIVSSSCSCPRGIRCHHTATLALFGHYNISVTDETCVWNIRKEIGGLVKTAEEMYPPTKIYNAVEETVSDNTKEEIRNTLLSLGGMSGFSWLLGDDVANIHEDLSIENIVSSPDFLQATDKIECFKEKCRLADDVVNKIARDTIGQTSNGKWYLLRKFRLTASNFGLVIAASKRKRYPESLFKTLLGSYNLDGIRAIQWGRSHEKVAIAALQAHHELDVEKTGLWLTNSGFLGASPDGLVGTDTIVEIKCPYSYRDDVLSEKLRNNKKYVLYYDEDNDICVNEEHQYYHQIQGTLHILKRTKCILSIWTPKETITVIIERDSAWEKNVKVLEEFYLNLYLPRLWNN